MGMFDELRCKYPLPVQGANDLLYQTKDTPDQYMIQHEIREDGTLWAETYHIEDRSDKTAPPGSLESVCGITTKVPDGWKHLTDFTGEVRFYSTLGGDDPVREPTHGPGDIKPLGWLEFSSYFLNGQLKQLHLIEHRKAGTDHQ